MPLRLAAHRSLVCEEAKSAVRSRLLMVLVLPALILSAQLSASDVTVRYKEGLTHGFLVLRTLDGKQVAVGDLLEIARGNQITSRLIYHFQDGSLQDETTVFSQRRSFSLITYHLVQKGPAFKTEIDMLVEVGKGQVTVRSKDEKGNEKTESEHLKLPNDLANGLVLTLLKNVPPDGALPQLSMVVATPKPRIVKLSLSQQGKEPFTLGGSRREALHYVIKADIGGLAGLVAPLLGKQPPDAHVWILGGEAPTFVKSETLSFLGGPIWRTELVSPVWTESEKRDSAETGGDKR